MKIVQLIRAIPPLNLALIVGAFFLMYAEITPVWGCVLIIVINVAVIAFYIWQHLKEEAEYEALYEAYLKTLEASEVKK